MALSQSVLLGLVAWCGGAPVLQKERERASALFFGETGPGPVGYWPGAGDAVSLERRFLGWFALSHRLASGERASMVAARQLLRSNEYGQTVRLLEQARYVTVVVRRVEGNARLVLELESERFEIRSNDLARAVQQDDAVVCHVVPQGWGRWLLGPGWITLPYRFGAGTRERLSQYQWDPIDFERFLQRRSKQPEGARPEPVQDATLGEAVARMTEAARSSGRAGLMLSAQAWIKLVQPYLAARDSTGFSRAVLDRMGDVPPADEANRWLQLATNIWNNTPQSDRGGKSAYQLVAESEGPMTLELQAGDLWMGGASVPHREPDEGTRPGPPGQSAR